MPGHVDHVLAPQTLHDTVHQRLHSALELWTATNPTRSRVGLVAALGQMRLVVFRPVSVEAVTTRIAATTAA
jgi:hypothetical protein